MRVVDVLVKSLNYLKRHGWTQGLLEDEDGRVCALGALYYSNYRASHKTRLNATRYLAAVTSPGVWGWNDTPGRLKGEVILAYEKAINNARRRHIKGD